MTAAFWRRLGEHAAERDRGQVDATLVEGLARARSAHPELALSDEAFFAYLGERALGDPADFLERIDPAELYLALACADDPRAQRRFEAAYFEEVRVGASRLRCSPEELDEIRQAVRLALFGPAEGGRVALLDKTARGDLRALIRLMALRAGISLRRKQGRELVGDDALLDVAASGDSPGSVVIAQQHRAKFRVALEAAIERLEPRDRALLRLHEVDGLSTATIARMYQVDRSTISRWLAKARASIFVETRRELVERHGVSQHHFESFIDVIRSNFAASIHRVLGEPG